MRQVKLKSVPQAPRATRVEADAQPLSAAEFSNLLALLAPRTPCAVAVSGGPDSMALALCLKRWKKNGVMAFIVDHALRPDSSSEASQTAKTLKKLGIPCEILAWQHEPIVARIHETARKARYALLINACKQRDISDLFLAHQREDQAETILMRLAKGSGVDGLAGMSTESMMDGIRLLRPLLGTPRARLAATCRNAKTPYVTDASNLSEKYARGRLRKVLPLLASEGLTIERLCDLGLRAAEARTALDHAASVLVRVTTKCSMAGVVRIDLEQLRSAPLAIALRLLTTCLQSIQPEGHAPERAALMRVLTALRSDNEMKSCTLHGCRISKQGATATLMREEATVSDRQKIKAGETIIWDQRWRVTLAKSERKIYEVRPLGNPPHAVLDKLAPDLRDQVPQGQARASLPALWLNGELALIPALPCSKYASVAVAELVATWPPGPHYAAFTALSAAL